MFQAAAGITLGVVTLNALHPGLVSALSGPGGANGGPSPAARAAVRFARAQLGKPYLWGGTGPDAFDCSGLVMQAYASAGVTVDRTSQDQWASERHVSPSNVVRGDLVFFAGSDGTATAPGHVAIVLNPARHTMVEAYATGFPVRISTYGLSTSPPGDQTVVGFTDPTRGAH
jgi:cell wall-associated NlpC family hydrolase